MKFILSGRVPSKKNSKRIVMAGRRPVIISSKDHATWHTAASFELRNQFSFMGFKVQLKGPLKVEITIYPPNRVRADLSNKAESIMDLLVDNGVIADDNWFEVRELMLKFGGVDPDLPRAEVEITSTAIPKSALTKLHKAA